VLKVIKWSFRLILGVTGILPFAGCSSGYREKDGKITFNGEEINGKNFIALNDVFAKDDSSAYYKRYSIDADVSTFTGLDKHYAKDKETVFYCDEEREGQNYYLTKHSVIFKVKGAEPATFTIMGEGYEGYAKDRKRAYFRGEGFEVKDAATLSIINGQFIKDKYQVYFERAPVKNADVNTFRVLNNCYARDTSRAYYYGFHNELYNGIHPIPCDINSFTILEYPYSKDNTSVFYVYNKIEGADANTFSVVKSDFSKDKNHVFIKTKILKGADAATFKVVPHNDEYLDEFKYTMDREHIFWKDKMLINVNINSFKVLGLDYSTDGKNIYFRTAVVKNADPSTFKTYNHGYGDTDAEDAKNKYFKGIKVVEEQAY
jgi:hypothetical protein